MSSKLWLVVLMISASVSCVAPAKLLAAREASREISEHNEARVLECLLPVIHSSGKALRLYYLASCDANDNRPVPFPVIKVQRPSQGKSGVEAVREIFQNDKNVTVTEEPVGIIKVSIGKVPTAILQTKLSSLTLEPLEQYNPRDAVAAIESTKEMEVAMRSLGISEPLKLGGTTAQPEEKLPHLPSSMSNVTVDEALDRIAKTWAGQGIVVYGACDESTNASGQRAFFIDYYGGILRKDSHE
jgi:hypothetical protein